ncbi:MAG: hypothetical protein ACE37D_05050 [Pseudomonadales bacterium]|jgi:gas vesicle protein
MKKLIAIAALTTLLAACSDESEVEQAADNAGDAMNDVAEGFGNAVDEIDGESAAEDAVEDIEAAAEDMANSVKDKAKELEEKAKKMGDG